MSRHTLSQLMFIAMSLALVASPPPATADTFPPDWNGGGGAAVHYAPVAWPTEGDGELDYGGWIAIGAVTEDQKVQDPSNGGTSPQNYVNISSGCNDFTYPSMFYAFDTANDVLFFRWRVEQIGHTYATGPNPGQPASAVSPWKSALWTVFFDIDGDGFREFAMHLDGSSGTPGADIDMLVTIYSDTQSHSLDYVNDPNVCELEHNPTAFTDGASDWGTGRILNFQNSVTPSPAWPGGNSETVWDYGSTRAVLVTHYNTPGDAGSGVACEEYFVDYQIPLAMLDATASPCGGPAITTDTPFCMAMATANSLNDPLQKDVLYEGTLCAETDSEMPYADCVVLGDYASGGGKVDQPMVNEVTAAGCGPALLSATVVDTLVSTGCGTPLADTINTVAFYYYFDSNANGVADDGNSWTFAASASVAAGEFNPWTASWDSTSLAKGQYLIGVRAEDDDGNVTWSHLTQVEVDASSPGDSANPSPEPGVLAANHLNDCGTSPSATKSASASEVVAGGTVNFTITVNASLAAALQLSQIDDFLPAGWTYDSTVGGTLSPTTSPSPGASGTISWTFSPAAVIAAGGSGTLVFSATAPAVVGSYQNSAQAVTNEGTFETNTVEVGVGAPRLTIAKSADTAVASPGGTVTWTVTYANDSPVSVTNAVITDVLPTGMTFVSATDGGSYDGPSRTITWNVGDLASGEGPFTVSFTTTIDSPYPSTADVPLVNTAGITSDQTAPAEADASVYINTPRPQLAIQKDGDLTQVLPAPPLPAPGANVNFTITYANTGNATAYGVYITDQVPTGWSYVSASAGCVLAGSTVTCTIGSLAAGVTGSVTITLNADPGAPNDPTVNTATIDGFSDAGLTEALPQGSDDFSVGLTKVGCSPTTTYYLHDGTPNDYTDSTAGVDPFATITASPTGAEFAWFYETPAASENLYLTSTNTTMTFYATKGGGSNPSVTVTLYDYNPGTATRDATLGSGSTSVSGGSKEYILAWAAAWSYTLPAGHQLLWVFTTGTSGAPVTLYFDGTAGGGNDSRYDLCTGSFDAVIDKQTSNLYVSPGSPATMTYTVKFANSNTGNINAAQVIDTLPAGVSYASAVLNTGLSQVAVTPQEGAGCTTCTFDVSTSDLTPPAPGAGTGILTAGQSGQLAITVNVDNPMAAGIYSMTNTAVLRGAEITDLSDSITTEVRRPQLTIAKAVDDTLLIPGDVATFTLEVTSVGSSNAASLSITDDFPDDTYFAYVAASCVVDTSLAPSTSTTNCSEAAGVLTATADLLAVGETLLVSFQMQVLTSPAPPAGVTEKSNTATVVDSVTPAASPYTSNTVTVSISTNPNLVVTKATPATSPLAVGEQVTYTLTVENTGSTSALDVVVTDAIPANTTFVLGSLVPDTGDTASYDAVNNQVVFDVGTLAAAELHTMSFAVVVDDPLEPTGTTSAAVDNTAIASSSNAASKQASADRTAEAAPVLSLVKSAPASLGWPQTTLAAAASATTVVQVNDPGVVGLNDYVTIAGTDTRVIAIGEALTALATAASSTTLIEVDDASGISTGDRLSVNGTIANVLGVNTAPNPDQVTLDTAVSGSVGASVSRPADTWTLSAAVTAGAGTSVYPVISFELRYENTGDAAATNVVVTDTLVANTVFVAADDGGVWAGPAPGTVTWSVGTVAPGNGGTLTFWSRPTTAGTYLNTGDIDSDQTALSTSNTTSTSVGALTPSKSTSTPAVTNTPTGTTARFTITVTNSNSAAATNLSITDTMEPGFSFFSNVSITGGTRDAFPPSVDPVAGDNPATWCCWTLNSGSTLTLTFDAALSNQVGDGTYQNQVSTSSSNVQALTFDELVTTQEDVTVTWLGPNHVLLSSFGASVEEGAVVVRWTSDAENRTAGFTVLRNGGTGWQPVNDTPVPALLASPGGGSYRLVDEMAPSGGGSSYLLVESQTDGTDQVWGPFVVDPGATMPRRDGLPESGFDAEPHALRPPVAPVARVTRQRQGSGTGLKIVVKEPGLYRVDLDDVASALGLFPGRLNAKIRSHRLRLSLAGEEVPWITDSRSHPTALLFYGQGAHTLYTRESVYLLEAGRGETFEGEDGSPFAAPMPGQVVRGAVRAEQDLRSMLSTPHQLPDDIWYWDFVYAGFGAKQFDFEVPEPAASSQAAELTVRLRGGTATAPGSHHVQFLLNGSFIGEDWLSGYDTAETTLWFDQALLADGPNTLTVEGFTDSGAAVSVVWLDWLELRYDRVATATGDEITVHNDGAEQLTIGGFSEPGVTLLDVSDPLRPVLVEDAHEAAALSGGYEVTFAAENPYGSYLAVGPAAVRSPLRLETETPSTLSSSANAAEYLVITRSDLVQAAQRLAAHRAGQGLSVMVVDVADIMDEFNGGQSDPNAVAAFLANAWNTWQLPPRLVAIAGEGTIDYFDVNGFGSNVVPPMLVAASWGLYASDSVLGDTDGDGIPEMAVGRIPVESAAQLDDYVTKIEQYELAGGSWTDQVLVVADDPDDRGNYPEDSERLILSIPPTQQVNRIYLTQMNPAEAAQELQQRLASGASLMTYLGHSGITTLANEGILTSADVPQMDNADRLPVIAALGCYLGYSWLPGYPSLAEDLVTHAGGGAAAVWTPVGMSYHQHRVVLGEAFLQAVYGHGITTLGDAVLYALQRTGSDPAGGGSETAMSQVLIGDPGLRVHTAAQGK